MNVKPILAVVQFSEHCDDFWMIYRRPRGILLKVLFGNISHVVRGIVFCQQMIERLFFLGAGFFRDALPPFIAVGKRRIDVKNHAAKRVFAVADDLSNCEFCFCVQHIESYFAYFP